MARSGRKSNRLDLPSVGTGLHRRGPDLGKVLPDDTRPDYRALGLGSEFELSIWLVLRRYQIPFVVQQNFDGGSAVLGGERADFVLLDRPVVIEALGPWHDLPGAALRDERKWEARRRDGYDVVTIHWSEEPNLEAVLLDRIGHPVVV